MCIVASLIINREKNILLTQYSIHFFEETFTITVSGEVVRRVSQGSRIFFFFLIQKLLSSAYLHDQHCLLLNGGLFNLSRVIVK